MIKLLLSRYWVLTILIVVFTTTSAVSQYQGVNQQQAQAELARRGLDDKEVLGKLKERGYDIDNLDKLPPSQYPQLEQDIAEIVAELEQAKAGSGGGGFSEEVTAPLPESVEVTPDDFVENDNNAPIVDASEVPSTQAAENKEKVGIYGHQIFRDNSIALYNSSDFDQAPLSYILREGDAVSVSIFGRSEASNKYEIQPGGFIQPKGLGRIYLEGLTFGEARELLARRFGQFYVFTPEQFAATLAYSQNVTINIGGEVRNPGSYTISGINTAFNALVASGGPNDIGTIRNIRVLKQGQPTQQLDVYEFLFNPDGVKPIYISNGSYISVPAAENVVRIEGAVKRPMRYELLDSETIQDLLNYAGGFASDAYKAVIQIERFGLTEKEVIDVDLAKGGASFNLQNGDVVTVRRVNETINNALFVEGDVDVDGRFDFSEGLRISDLLRKAGLRKTSRTDFAYLVRRNDDGTVSYEFLNLDEILANAGDKNINLELQRGDRLKVFANSQFVTSGLINIGGAIREPQEFEVDQGTDIRLLGAIELAGGLKDNATELALITRQLPQSPDSVEFFRINLNTSIAEDFPLLPGDEVRILARETFAEDATVTIEGAVRSPGTFNYAENLKLEDLILQANGFKFGAEPDRVDVYRLKLEANPIRTERITLTVDENILTAEGDFKIHPYDKVIIRYRENFEFQQFMRLEGEVAYPGKYAIVDPNETLTDLIERAGGLTEEAYSPGATLFRTEDSLGYVAIALDKALERPQGQDNLVVKEGDILTIPKTLELVTIQGAVNLDDVTFSKVAKRGRISAPYYSGKRARFYIKEFAGGVAERGDVSEISVVYPNGSVKRTRNILFFQVTPKVSPGSIVSVPYEPVDEKDLARENEEEPEPVNWGEVAANIVGQAVSILSLILLLNRAN